MLTRKIAADSAWSYAAFGVMAVSGLGLNVVIGARLGASGLGVFSQTMAVFVIVSHLAVLGLHNATFRTIALVQETAQATAAGILASALLAALPFAIFTAVITAALAAPLGRLFDSPATGQAILWMAPGLFFFGLNKIGLAALNGLTLMRRYAGGQMLRYLVIGGVAVGVALHDDGPARLGAAFTAAEILVSLYLLVATASIRRAGRWRASLAESREMLAFGIRSAGAGLMTELNLRIDTVMLGWFLSDRDVGIYAFAAMLIEGLGNVALVLRTLVNPYLTRLLAARDSAGIRRLQRRVQLATLPVVIAAFIGAWLLFQPLVRLAVGPGDLELALAPLLILIAMMAPYFTYSAFEDTMMLAGHAGTQSLYQLSITATNAALNLAFIPLFGIVGAAVATGLASLVACLGVIIFIRRATTL